MSGLANTKLIAGAVSSEVEISTAMVAEAGIGSRKKRNQLRGRAISTALREECRKSEEESHAPKTNSGDLDIENVDKRTELLTEFQSGHGFIAPFRKSTLISYVNALSNYAEINQPIPTR